MTFKVKDGEVYQTYLAKCIFGFKAFKSVLKLCLHLLMFHMIN